VVLKEFLLVLVVETQVGVAALMVAEEAAVLTQLMRVVMSVLALAEAVLS
jgi:hypothetical protein